MTTPTLHRPEPIRHPDARPVDGSTPPAVAAARLRDGEALQVRDRYRTGLAILEALHTLLAPPADDAGYERRRGFQRAYREASDRLLAPIVDHAVALEASPAIGFLRQLYPELPRFVLSFRDVQNLSDAWRIYERGTHLAVLGHRVHPFYGTYAPTRTTHLELFGTWLSQYDGPRDRAIDVGTGCGVLALMLGRAGFEHILATDDNPNAVESVRRELQRLDPPPPIEPVHTDLLGEDPTPVDLVVFNPPWVKGTVDGLLDRALTFEDGLFERFFDQAIPRIAPSGRIVVVFSDLIRLVQPDVPHPIEAELARGRLQLAQKMRRKVPSQPGRRTRERVEVWELTG